MEVERKFLVVGDYKPFISKSIRITQGYLSLAIERTVRVRIQDDKGYITVKGASDNKGVSRFEWEKEIPHAEAKELLTICEPSLIDKTRCLIPAGKHTFEVDEFHGENEGLTLAEIELTTEDEKFEKPSWLGREVTGDMRFYNSMLAKHPYAKRFQRLVHLKKH